MADSDGRRRAAGALRQASDPRIPHPSWRQANAGGNPGAARIRSAGEFWQRLGI